jgi:hypothetical protein
MAGINANFDGAAFRTAIQFVYTMAAAPVPADRIKFYFASTLVYTESGGQTGVDGIGLPFDPQSTVVRTQAPPVSVACGIEYLDKSGQTTVFGDVIPATVMVTLLDEDYVQVQGCAYIVLHGEKYKYVHTNPPSGLFDVGLFILEFQAENAA